MDTIQTIKQNNGATLNSNLSPVTLKTGYQVSKRDLLAVDASTLSMDMLEMVKRQQQPKRGEYIGVWIEAGKAYIDISKRIASRKAALQAGRDYNQISIWDWKKQKAIYCKDGE